MKNDNRLWAVLLCCLMGIGMLWAKPKVKGELHTEINGFQWYCYKGKQAYTVDGQNLNKIWAKNGRNIYKSKRLINNLKWLDYKAYDKDDPGRFMVSTSSAYDVHKCCLIFDNKGKYICYIDDDYGVLVDSFLDIYSGVVKKYYAIYQNYNTDNFTMVNLCNGNMGDAYFKYYTSLGENINKKKTW